MIWVTLAAIGTALLLTLYMCTPVRAGRATYLPWLDLISYVLTSVTVVAVVITMQGQIDRLFKDMTGQDLDLSAARTELNQFLGMQCGQEPECAEVALAILGIANPRAVSKIPSRVDADVSRLPALAAVVDRYNDAYDQSLARNSIMFLNVGFWIAVVAMCGAIIGVWRRILVLFDAIATVKT